MAATLRAVDDLDTPSSFDDEGSVMVDDRYELIGRIGRGATGSVYRAYDRTLDRHVALKMLKPGELAVAEREAQVLAKVTHRNVVTIHDFGQSEGQRFLVLELLEGCDFCTWLRERRPSAQVVQSFVEAGRGLQAAHLAGLVHRDFKPSNVIRTHEGRVVVIDFGLARNLDSLCGSLELQHFTEGTLAYMAPERLAGHENDERSDQFSFCVAMWEALSGDNPFTGADPLARFRSIRNGPARVQLDAPTHVVRALERGMSFEPDQRFSTMGELLRELERTSSPVRRQSTRPVLTAVAIAATFLLGWGFAPDSPTIEEAHSSLDPRADAALSILESARKRAVDGDHRTALNDLLYAAELITVADDPGGTDYCSFAGLIPNVADELAAQRAEHQARMAYAIAIHFAQDCPDISATDVKARRESARSAEWAKTTL